MTSRASWQWVLPYLACPSCGQSLEFAPDRDAADGILVHGGAGCTRRYPVVDGIPRLLLGRGRRAVAMRHAPRAEAGSAVGELLREWLDEVGTTSEVVAGFDYEWARFADVDTDDIRRLYRQYFDLVPSACLEPANVVLDAGCGAGRWAYQVARGGPRVIALDMGLSVELAAQSTTGLANVACVQGDLGALPIRQRSVDWCYSLGVLHHTDDPPAGLRQLVSALRPGGGVLLYLYYDVGGRNPIARAAFALATGVRRVMSVSPRAVVQVVALLFAMFVYLPLARFARVLRSLGLRRLAEGVPLSFYADRSFRTMRNDSLDRFGTRIEWRFSRDAMAALMRDAGLRHLTFSEGTPYWHAIGWLPSSGPEAEPTGTTPAE